MLASDSYLNDSGDIDWPTPDGAVAGTQEEITLEKGSLIDRFGRPSNSYASPAGTPYAQRALPYVPNANAYHLYRVLQDIPNVMQGIIAGGFDQSGGGVQYQFTQSIQWLLNNGYITEVFPD